MATLLTINTTPLAINPAYRSIPFKVTSTDTTIKAVRADLYIGGTYSTTINGTQVLGTTDQFNFDISKIMQGNLVSELRTNITSFAVTDAVTSAKTIKMRFFEIVETAGVFVTTWAANGAGINYLESSNYNVVNMATQHQETLSDWVVDDTTKKLLTLKTTNNRIPRGVPFQVGFISNSTNFIGKVTTYNASLGVIATTTTAILASITSGKGVIEIPESLYSSSSVAFMDVKLARSTGTSVVDFSTTYRHKIVDAPKKFTIFIQNHLGDFDHFDFGNKVKTEVNTSNQRMKKALTEGFSPEDAGIITVASTTKTKVVVETSALSSGELTMLGEFVKNHSVVYKWDSAGTFLRYALKSHSKKIADSSKLINSIQLTLQPSNEHIVQHGD